MGLRFRRRRSRSQGLVVQGRVSRRILAWRTGWSRRTEHAEDARTFPVGGQVSLRFELKRDVLAADGADQCAIGSAALLNEHVVAHDALATDGNPKVWRLRRSQEPPIQGRVLRIIHRKTACLCANNLVWGPRIVQWLTRCRRSPYQLRRMEKQISGYVLR